MNLLETIRINPRRFRGWLVNVVTSYADLGIGALVYLVMTPIIISKLGTEAYGVWILCHTITFYLGFLDLGFSHAQIRYHAEFAARDQTREIRSLIGTTVTLLTIAGLAAAILATVLAFSPIGHWLNIPDDLSPIFRTLLLILGVELLLSFPAATLDDIYTGTQRFDLQNLRSIVLRIVASLSQFLLLWFGHGLVALALVELATVVAQILIDLIMAGRLVPGLFSRETRFSAGMWHRIRSFSLWTQLDDLLVEGTAYLDRFLVTALLPLAMLSPYVIMNTLAGLLLEAVRPVAETFFPMACELHGQQRRDALAKMTLAGMKLNIALAAPLAVFLVFFGDAVLAAWIPEIAGDISPALVALAALNMYVSVFLWTPGSVLLAMGEFRKLAALTTFEILVSVILMIAFVPAFGLMGIVAALLISNVLLGFGFLLPLLTRKLSLNYVHWIGPTLGRIGFACLPGIFVALTVRFWLDESKLAVLVVSALATAATCLGGLVLLGTNRLERHNYMQILRGLGWSAIVSTGPIKNEESMATEAPTK